LKVSSQKTGHADEAGCGPNDHPEKINGHEIKKPRRFAARLLDNRRRN
jgi:hypothetical protein